MLMYIDAFAGCAGDMILGALIDAGYSPDDLRRGLSGLGLDGYAIDVRTVTTGGIAAIKVDVNVTSRQPHRGLSCLMNLFEQADLPAAVKARCTKAFQRLISVEAAIHRQPPEEVHLHEVGAVDAIVDITGTFLAVEALGIKQICCSPLPLGRGFVTCAHGEIPLPAPAAVALLKGTPVYAAGIAAETVTPTGALLATELAQWFGPIPTMTLLNAAYGAGSRDHGPRPNLLRLLLGQPVEDSVQPCGAVVIETNIDDMNPELLGFVCERLWEAGALDVSLIPLFMKKQRPGTMVHVVCRPEDQAALELILLRETSTIGVRSSRVARRVLDRKIISVPTQHGAIRVKLARLPGGGVKAAPEYDDCRQAARDRDVPVQHVYSAALAAARKQIEQEGAQP